jgi:DNA-binding transcriptional ArsR family regulator
MTETTTVLTVLTVRDRERAALILHPLRLRILEQAREPASAAEIARRIGETPQKVNYHVGALADAGFLRPAGEGRRRNFVERRYRATARHYVISPEVLGEVGLPAGGPASAGDAFSAARLLGLTAQVQGELGASLREAAAAGAGRVPTLSMDAEVRFASASERARFAADLREAVFGVVARYGGGERGWPFRVVVGCYPLPGEGDESSEQAMGAGVRKEEG